MDKKPLDPLRFLLISRLSRPWAPTSMETYYVRYLLFKKLTVDRAFRFIPISGFGGVNNCAEGSKIKNPRVSGFWRIVASVKLFRPDKFVHFAEWSIKLLWTSNQQIGDRFLIHVTILNKIRAQQTVWCNNAPHSPLLCSIVRLWVLLLREAFGHVNVKDVPCKMSWNESIKSRGWTLSRIFLFASERSVA